MSDRRIGASALSVQQQILPRASIEIAYNRRWFPVSRRLTIDGPSRRTTRRFASPPRWTRGCRAAVATPFQGCTTSFPTLSGQIDNLTRLANKYGEWYQNFNGVDVTLNVRTRGGLTFQGGTSTGRTVVDACDVRANLPELNATLGAGLAGSMVNLTSPYCHVNYGWLTQVRGLATYTVPKVDMQVSGVFQSKPGALLAANYDVPAAEVASRWAGPCPAT